MSARNNAICQHCGKESPLISQGLGLCLGCIQQDFSQVLPLIEKAHSQARRLFNLLPQPPRSESELQCRICMNECRVSQGSRGYCGLRTNQGSKFKGATASKGNVSGN